MTKQTFILVAQSINSQRYALRDESCDRAIQTSLTELSLVLAGKFAEKNPKFDREKFLNACGSGRVLARN